ncbi:MAG: LytTR family DNA-binding domain-containing protein [Bacteroidales bacterium]|jgi:DNA-binding LytR/AlgR family response regulator
MKIFKAYILDDEPLAIKSLKKKLESHPEIKIIGESTRMSKAFDDVSADAPDILFLDIQLAEGTGFDFLNNVRFAGKVVFVTAYDEYAFRAFEVNALDYLLKPVSDERMNETINKIKNNQYNYSNNDPNFELRYRYSDRLFVVERNQIHFVLIENVTRIYAARDYSFIETNDGKKSIIMRTMAEWEVRLPKEHFVRVHRSYIVNINHIEKIIRNSTSTAKIYLKNIAEPVSLSRTYYKNLRNNYL